MKYSDKEYLIIKEWQSRNKIVTAAFNVEKYCFSPQVRFIRDKSKRKVAVCSRRAGKTKSLAAYFIDTAVNNRRVNVFYITLTRKAAKRIMWRDLTDMLDEHKIPYKANEQDLTVEIISTQSFIYLSGAKDESEIEKFRGMHAILIALDEVQSFKPYVIKFIDEVLNACLFDYNGTLVLTGTPNPTCKGALYDADHNKDALKGYSRHHWTMLDNPHIKLKSGIEPIEILKEELRRREVDESDPIHQRENLGKWVKSQEGLLFHYSEERNLLPALPNLNGFKYVLGGDIGFKDSDALVVWAFSSTTPEVYVVEHFKASGQLISTLANKILELNNKYKFFRKVFDCGGLGKKIVEEINDRHKLNIEAAEKTRKAEFIRLMNDDFKSGKIKTLKGELVDEWETIQMDIEKGIEDERFECDLSDAALYGWRECLNWRYKEPIIKTPEQVEIERIENFLKQSVLKKQTNRYER